jgi:hypothetical protein
MWRGRRKRGCEEEGEGEEEEEKEEERKRKRKKRKRGRGLLSYHGFSMAGACEARGSCVFIIQLLPSPSLFWQHKGGVLPLPPGPSCQSCPGSIRSLHRSSAWSQMDPVRIHKKMHHGVFATAVDMRAILTIKTTRWNGGGHKGTHIIPRHAAARAEARKALERCIQNRLYERFESQPDLT